MLDDSDYMSTAETATFLNVSQSTVKKWYKKGWLLPDVIGHDKRGRGRAFYYSRERILQLASVYQKKLSRHTSDTDIKQTPIQEVTNQADTANEPQIVDEKQSQINETAKFFHLLYSKITTPHFAYLWTKQKGIFSFSINDETQREDMAIKAVELSDCGVDVWHAVNTVCLQPTDDKRGDESVVSYQVACVVDIDIRSVAHKGDPSKLAADFDEAKSFLPFLPA